MPLIMIQELNISCLGMVTGFMGLYQLISSSSLVQSPCAKCGIASCHGPCASMTNRRLHLSSTYRAKTVIEPPSSPTAMPIILCTFPRRVWDDLVGAMRGPQGTWTRPSALLSPRCTSGLIPKLAGSLLSRKKSSKSFGVFELRLVPIS